MARRLSPGSAHSFLAHHLGVPGKGLRWHLRSCYYRIRNLLRHGRSIDSLKHCDLPSLWKQNQPTGATVLSELKSAVDVRQDVSARDSVSELVRLLKPQDRHVLLLLANGNSVQDVAELLGL